MAKKEKAAGPEIIRIQPANMQRAIVRIRGIGPYVQKKWSEKAKEEIRQKHQSGQQARSKKVRTARDFQAEFEDSIYAAEPGGWHGFPATALRGGLISVCRLVGFKMTLAKLSLFIEADGFDRDDRKPLVRITKGEPRLFETMAKTTTGVATIAIRGLWEPGWEAAVRVRWDADQFSATDIVNLMSRFGQQAGIGEGRNDSRNSNGQGWGEFEVMQ